MSLKFISHGKTHEIVLLARRPEVRLAIDGRTHDVHPDPAPVVVRDGNRFLIRLDGRTHVLSRVDPRAEAAGAGGVEDAIRAPMPGAVISLHAAVGDAVKAGQVIVTIESMKLQTALASPRDGVIAELTVAEGDTFEKDARLVTLEPLAEAEE